MSQTKRNLSVRMLIIGLAIVLLSEIVIWSRGGSGASFYSKRTQLHTIEPSYYEGYQISDNSFVPENEDPQIGFYFSPCRVESVKISFSRPLESETEIQLYYAGNGIGLSDDHCIVIKAEPGAESVIIDLPGGVYDQLRADINGPFFFDNVQISKSDPIFQKTAADYLRLVVVVFATLSVSLILLFLFADHLFGNDYRITKFFHVIYRYRLAICAVVFVFAVFFELSGSSIGMWDTYVHDASHLDEGIVIGKDRAIRSDEWAIFTPMALSQYHNDFGLKNNILRATETDVYMVYGQPVRDWSIVFRPFQIGYLFLDAAKGLSFYWIGKLITLFLVSLEFGLLLTDQDKRYALTYAFMVTLGPVVQWWFSVNAFPDMLVYGQGIVLCVTGYMRTESYKKRILYTLGLYVLCGAYFLVIYPAWQVPFFYVFLGIGSWFIISNWKKTHIEFKKDIPLLGAAVLLLGISMSLIVSRSLEAIRLVMDSVYPGHRMNTGGVGVSVLFRYAGNLFLPFINENIPENECEMALFFGCFPLGITAAALRRYYNKNRDSLTCCLFILLSFLGIYVVLGFPLSLSKLLLMSNSQGGRALVAFSYVDLLLLIRSATLINRQEIRLKPSLIYVCSACLALSAAYLSYRYVYTDYYSLRMLVICVIVLSMICLTALKGHRAFCAIMIVLNIVIGGAVNPIRTGLGFMNKNVLGQKIQSLAEQSDGKWLVITDRWTVGNYLVIYGAPTINCTNTYMNVELWKQLDPTGLYEDRYNRYAHITVELTDTEKTRPEVLNDDWINIILNVDDLSKIGVEYLVSENDLSGFGSDKTIIIPVFSDPNVEYVIYRVETSG